MTIQKIIGMSAVRREDGRIYTTLYLSSPFESYFNSPENGRSCQGEMVDKVYVADYDCKNLKVGMEINIFYDKAVSSKKGVFQQIVLIQPVTK